MIKKAKRVIVAMSGGVDSSAVAAILKKEGHDVRGVFFRLWKEVPSGNSEKNIQDLKKVCAILDIPLKIIDLEKRFKKEVVKYFLEEYKNGRTPNPCAICNKNIKFKVLFEEMLKMKADYVATGHYASVIFSKVKTKNIFGLGRAVDENKDQSYFLYSLTQRQLAHILFPMGKYEKSQTRKMAKEFGLLVFDKAESQDICFFMGKVEDFLRRNLKLKEGDIIDSHGKFLGRHKGLPLYTIGQRKGIEIGGTGPYFVAGMDFKKNILKVAQKDDIQIIFSQKMKVSKINWIVPELKFPLKALIKTRYRSLASCGIIEKQKRDYVVQFSEPQKAITPGQVAVFYNKKKEVLGGGIIES